MPRIFISYRRTDSSTISGRIYDHLVAAFGERSVFKDVYDIPAGSDFRKVIEQGINACQVQLVIIGPNWLDARYPNGERRLDDATDFVRIELEAGLRSETILLIPVLVSGAHIPTADELPVPLRELVFRNAVVIRDDPDFRGDMQHLIESLPNRNAERSNRMRRTGLIAAATVVFAAFILVLTARTVANWYKAAATPTSASISTAQIAPTNEFSPTLAIPATSISVTPNVDAAAQSGNTAQSVAALLQQGGTLQGQGRYEEAIARYSEAITLEPTNAEAYYRRGNAYHEHGNDALAVQDLTSAINLNPSDPEPYRERGWTEYEQSNFQAALADFNLAIERDSHAAAGYVGRGTVYRDTGRYTAALDDYTQAITLDPNYSDAYYQRGLAYHENHRFELALADFHRALELNPDDAETNFQLAAIEFYDMSDHESALKDVLRTIELAPDHANAYALLGDIYYADGQKQDALEQYRRYAQLAGDNADQTYLARIHELESAQ